MLLLLINIVYCPGTFQVYDSDQDGYISRQDMERVVDSIYKMVGHMVTFPEGEETPQQRVGKIFEIMDQVRTTKPEPLVPWSG